MHCLFPENNSLVPVNTAEDFVYLIAAHGMTFDLNKKTIDKWNNDISCFSKNSMTGAKKLAAPKLLPKAVI